jgi:LmbE family N-acetylglucosaminyl deacetylase
MKRSLFLALALCFLFVIQSLIQPRAQMRVTPVAEEGGHVALGLTLRHLANTGIFMHATAHPDDENNGLLVLLNRGQGYRTALATATRGNGGQNEIGAEIFEALGVLRTEELAAVHRFDGAEQYFTRAVDFGYSFSIEETFEKWGREEIVADFVRLIRTVRPDVVLSLRPDGDGGGQHHQASAVLAREAYRLAGDPAAFPEQLKDGLRPWQPRKFYSPAPGAGGRGAAPVTPGAGQTLSVNLAVFDPLLGRTYSEIGTEARSMHKCQGMAQLLSLPGPAASSFQLVESTLAGQTGRAERSLFDGIDTSIGGLAHFAGPRPPRELSAGLQAIALAVQDAQKRFDTLTDDATLQPLLTGLTAVRSLRAQLRALPLEEGARFELEFRLRQKEREFQQAILLANAVRIETLADDGVVVPGQPVRVSVTIANRGPVDVSVKQVRFEGFGGGGTCDLTLVTGAGAGGPGGRGRPDTEPASAAVPVSTLRKDQVARCEPTLAIPADAATSEPYWHRDGESGRYTFDPDAPFGLPYRPTPFYVQTTLAFGAPGGEEVIDGSGLQYRYEGNIFSGEKRSQLLVVPALSVRVSPEIAIIPSSHTASSTTTSAAASQPAATTGSVSGQTRPAAPGQGRGARPAARASAQGRGGAPPVPPTPPAPQPSTREIRVTVVNASKGPAQSVVTLDLPSGWTATPGQHAVEFAREDESQTVRFEITPGPQVEPGAHRVAARAALGDQTFTRGHQAIEYPHITRRHIFHDAATTVKIVDVTPPPRDLALGYVMGVGDEVPAAISQLGVKVEMIGADDLAWGDLSRFRTIVTGVRAYERRADLRANNGRLIQYVRNGGTLVVQYNKFEFNDAQYGPYPAVVSADRVTDEFAPVRLLAPADPLLTSPNRIADATWSGWVQERGLYFLGERDSRYRDLVELEDPFPNNPGVKRGALVAANYGKGRWIYVGLGLWRELPAGVEGAYQLLANLIAPR